MSPTNRLFRRPLPSSSSCDRDAGVSLRKPCCHVVFHPEHTHTNKFPPREEGCYPKCDLFYSQNRAHTPHTHFQQYFHTFNILIHKMNCQFFFKLCQSNQMTTASRAGAHTHTHTHTHTNTNTSPQL